MDQKEGMKWKEIKEGKEMAKDGMWRNESNLQVGNQFVLCTQ